MFQKQFVVAALASQATAFPALMTDPDSPLFKRAQDIAARATPATPSHDPLQGLENGLASITGGVLNGISGDQGHGWLPLVPPAFDAKSQYVSNKGRHAFVAPTSTDSRGPCPGLNAAANHGYLPHNGKATVLQFIEGTYAVFGMERDLGGFLALYGALIDGDGLSWQIGGIERTGISGSHHNYEDDSSPTRGDLNQYGDLASLQMSQWNELFNLQPDAATANYNLDVLTKHRERRFQESISKNPYFYYGPFDGILVSQAAHTFIYRFMANKSAEHPEGILNQDVLKSFFSIQGSGKDAKWVPGHEKIPDNWYKRNALDTYSLVYFNADVIAMALKFPRILEIGCNMGKVNTYNSLDVSTLTNAVSTVTDLLGNPFCTTTGLLLGSAQSLLGVSQSAATNIQKQLQPYLNQVGCKGNYTEQSLQQLKNCPGFSLYGGPTGPIAPGAIQG